MRFPADERALKRSRRGHTIDEAADRLKLEVERQDTAGYRDWAALVEAVVDVRSSGTERSLSDFAPL